MGRFQVTISHTSTRETSALRTDQFRAVVTDGADREEADFYVGGIKDGSFSVLTGGGLRVAMSPESLLSSVNSVELTGTTLEAFAALQDARVVQQTPDGLSGLVEL